MKISLLGLEFAVGNLGCEALSYSFVNLLSETANRQKIECEFIAIVSDPFDSIKIADSKVSCIKIRYKSLSFWRKIKKEFKSSNLIVDFTGGDSFSDIYGLKRFLTASLIKKEAVKSGTPFMLGPQTYGPFNNRICEIIAGKLIKSSKWVFARDEISCEYAQRISKRKINLTTDVAFALPYEKKQIKSDKIKVGINPSGFLWNGGYSKAKIQLAVNYQKYIFSTIDRLYKSGKYEIYLIPHVGTTGRGGVECDYEVCELIKAKYPNCIFIDSLITPMDAKNIISSMDVFSGARMHATIGAFSSGVATIPFSYSRKFDGLYGGLNYPYLIEAMKETTEEAIEKTIEWVESYPALKKAVDESMSIVSEKQNDFISKLSHIISVTN